MRDTMPFGKLLRLYLDPFALLKEVSGAEALQYNRRHRRMLLIYVRRWALIALVCLGCIAPLAALERPHPAVWLALAPLELGFSAGLCLSFFAAAAYVVLGLER